MSPRIFLLWLGVSAPFLLAQSLTRTLQFEIASVRPSDPSARVSNIVLDPGEGLRIANVPLRQIVTYAYDIRDFQLSGGPGWMDVERFDIAAKAASGPVAADPPADTDDQRRARLARVRERLRSLLAARFHLSVHVEEREQTLLTLGVGKGGPKFHEAGAPQGRLTMLDGHVQGFGVPVSMLATQISMAVGQIVEDRTGLAGKYDFVLDWAAGTQERDPDRASIFTALDEQLGLRLERTKGRVQTVVVDRIERPTAN